MELAELNEIVEQELLARPGAPNIAAWCDLVLRELRFLPALEVRRAVQAFYAFPTCARCATRSNRWPHPEEIRAQIPGTVIEKCAAQNQQKEICPECDGTGWVLAHTGQRMAAIRCHCKAEYSPGEVVSASTVHHESED